MSKQSIHHSVSDVLQVTDRKSEPEKKKKGKSTLFFLKNVEPSWYFKLVAPARALVVIKYSMSCPDCSGMLEKELGDPYVPSRVPQLSGLFRSHPNQCVSLEPAASGEQVHKSQPSYVLRSAAGSRRDAPAPKMRFSRLLTRAAVQVFVVHCAACTLDWWERCFVKRRVLCFSVAWHWH